MDNGNTDCAYAAAFLDGEGFLGIHPQNTSKAHLAQVGISNTYLPALEWLVVRGGGRICERHREVARVIWDWRIHGDQAAPFLRDVRPFLHEKTALADNLIAFFVFRDETRALRHQYTT